MKVKELVKGSAKISILLYRVVIQTMKALACIKIKDISPNQRKLKTSLYLSQMCKLLQSMANQTSLQ